MGNNLAEKFVRTIERVAIKDFDIEGIAKKGKSFGLIGYNSVNGIVSFIFNDDSTILIEPPTKDSKCIKVEVFESKENARDYLRTTKTSTHNDKGDFKKFVEKQVKEIAKKGVLKSSMFKEFLGEVEKAELLSKKDFQKLIEDIEVYLEKFYKKNGIYVTIGSLTFEDLDKLIKDTGEKSPFFKKLVNSAESFVEYLAMFEVARQLTAQSELRANLIKIVKSGDVISDDFTKVLIRSGSKRNELSRANVATYLDNLDLIKMSNRDYEKNLAEAIKI